MRSRPKSSSPLSLEKKKDYNTAFASIDLERCRRSAHHFIFNDHLGQRLVTKDEHDIVNPIKPFPDEDYLRSLLDCLLVSGKMITPREAYYALRAGHSESWLAALYNSGIVCVEKSRHVMATWLACCYCLWRAKFRPHQLIIIQSKREEDAANLVFNKEPYIARISFLESHLPDHLKSVQFPSGGCYGHLYFPNGSHIWAIPEGGDIIRSNNPSVIFSDEAAFQPEFGAAYTAAIPAMKGGGQLVAISSAEPGEFEQLIEATDPGKDERKLFIPGLSERITRGGIPVLAIDYWADPKKRPGTPEGDLWLEHELAGYPGGQFSPRWRKEMLRDWGAMGGTRLFLDWEMMQKYVVCPPFDPIGYKLYASYDHGWRNPAAYHVHGINGDGEIVTFWEFYADHVPIPQIARIIKGQSVTLPDGRHFEGNPFAGEEIIKIADPHMWAEDQPMSDNTMKAVAQLFEMEGVFFEKGERGGDTTVAEWLIGHFWADPKKPRYRITSNCPKLIWEIGQQRHKDISPRVGAYKDSPEGLIDKNNHAWDGLKMFLKLFPPTPQEMRQSKKPGSFNWWKEQAKKAAEGQEISTYHREMVG